MKTRFSRRTWLAGLDLLEKDRRLSHAAFTSFLIELGPDIYSGIRDEPGSLTKRFNDLKMLVDREHGRLIDGEPLEDLLVEKAISNLLSSGFSWQSADFEAQADKFRWALQQDGYTLTDGALRRQLPVDIRLPEVQSELIRLLDTHELSTPKVHLTHALDNHADGKWEPANSQIRTFLESLFDELAVKIDPSGGARKPGIERRTYLANVTPPLLDRALFEWNDNGAGFMNGLFARLNTKGSHPGISDHDDCTFRLHVVLLTAKLILSRFDARLRSRDE